MHECNLGFIVCLRGEKAESYRTFLNMKKTHNYCVILAGGVGKRLWPCSTKERPKQFIDFFGTGQTLLQQTYERVSRFIVPQNIYISTYVGYADFVREQLPDVSDDNVLTEPVQLSTAPAVAWASYHISLHDPKANIVVMPCDQLIIDEARFAADVEAGLDFVAENSKVLVIGVKAHHPNTAYGYIQTGDELGDGRYDVKSFTEKPNEQFARMFVESGEFLWNTGLFAWNVETMKQMVHEIMQPLDEALAEKKNMTRAEKIEYLKQHYPTNAHQSIDLFILRKSSGVVVQECSFGWADLGNWPDMGAVAKKDIDGNAVVGNNPVMFYNSQNNVVCMPDRMAAVIHGLDGFLVAMNDNIIVICPENDPALVWKIFNEVQFTLGDKYV